MDIVKKLTKYKELTNLSINEISNMTNIPVSTVSRVFSGKTENPSFETIAAIARAMNVSLDELAEMPTTTFKCEVEVLVSKVIGEKNKMLSDKDADLCKKEKWIKVLFVTLVVMFLVFATILIFDLSRGDIGYIRY